MEFCIDTTQIYTHVHIDALREVHTRCHPHGKLGPDRDMHGKLTAPEITEPQPDGDFASHQTTEALNAAAMVTACEKTPLVSAQEAVRTRSSGPQTPPEDDPPAGNAPKSPPPPPKPPSGGFFLNSLPTNDSSVEAPSEKTTGVTDYSYRWYDPITGRWPSRDPIEERGGINLYGFVGNDAVGRIDLLGTRYSEVYGESPTYVLGKNTYTINSFFERPNGYYNNNQEQMDNIIKYAKELGEIKDSDGNDCFDVIVDYRPATISMIHGYSSILYSPDDLFFLYTHGDDYKLNPEKRADFYRLEQYVWLLDGAIRTQYLKSLFRSKVFISACYHWPNRDNTTPLESQWISNEKWFKDEFQAYAKSCNKCPRERKIVITSGPASNRIPKFLQKNVVNDLGSDPGIEYDPGNISAK
jgi:RHS repeat-associated protein